MQPQVHWDVAGFEGGIGLDGERLAAGIALVGTDPGGPAAELAGALGFAAVGAHTTVRPDAP